jgi:drug/metabolite transporter (DMT)-like permease
VTAAAPTSRTAPASTAAIWLALSIVYVVWGSTYFGIAIAIETIPPFVSMAIRFTIAGSVLLLWEIVRGGRDFRVPTLRQVRDAAVVGVLLLGIGNGFVALGELTVPSGIAAILVAMIPLWFAVFGRLYFRDRLPRLVLLGIVIGLAGVAILAWPGGPGAEGLDPVGLVILIAGPIGWSHGTLYSARRADLPTRPLTNTAVQMLAGAVALTLEATITGEWADFRPEAVSVRSIVAMAYLIVVGSMVAFNAYAWLLRNAPLSLVGTYAYVNPIVAVALGTAFLGEVIEPRTLFASAVIVAAVALIVTARSRASRAEAAAPVTAAPPAGTSPSASHPLHDADPAESAPTTL